MAVFFFLSDLDRNVDNEDDKRIDIESGSQREVLFCFLILRELTRRNPLMSPE
jgi:hypothetical protein